MKPIAMAIMLALASYAFADETPRFSIKQFHVEGNTVLPQERINAVLQSYVGDGRDFADVQRALEALEGLYRKLGYGAAQLYLPEQELNQGVVIFKVIEPKLDKIKVEGQRFHSEANVRRALPALREGAVPNTAAVSESLRLANESGARQLAVSLQGTEDPQKIDAVVKVTDEAPGRWFAMLDNTGNKETGDYRLSLGYQYANLFDLDHTVTVQATTSPEKPGKVKIVGLGYRVPLYARGDALNFFTGYSNVESASTVGVNNSTAIFNVTGKGQVFGARYIQQLTAQGEYRHKLQYGIDWRQFDTELAFNNGKPQASEYAVRPLSVNYLMQWQKPGLALDGNIGVSANWKGGAADNLAQSGRGVANDSYWLMRFGGNLYFTSTADWLFHLALNGQYTSNALVPGEQYGAGGASSVRAYAEREISNDKGINYQLEGYSPDLAAKLGWSKEMNFRLLAFYDAAYLSRNKAVAGEAESNRMSAAGIGVRMGWGKSAALKFDVARALRDADSKNATGTKKGDVETHLSAVFSY